MFRVKFPSARSTILSQDCFPNSSRLPRVSNSTAPSLPLIRIYYRNRNVSDVADKPSSATISYTALSIDRSVSTNRAQFCFSAPAQLRETFPSEWRPCCSPPPRTTASPRRSPSRRSIFEELAGKPEETVRHRGSREALIVELVGFDTVELKILRTDDIKYREVP